MYKMLLKIFSDFENKIILWKIKKKENVCYEGHKFLPNNSRQLSPYCLIMIIGNLEKCVPTK